MKKIEDKNKIVCSECGRKEARAFENNRAVALGLLSFGIFSTSICMFPLFWIALPFTIIITLVGAICLLFSIFIKSYIIECQECKTKFSLTKEEYEEVKARV